MAYLIFTFTVVYVVPFTSSTMMCGAPQDQDPDSPQFMDMAWRAAKPLNEDSAANSGPYAMMPVKLMYCCGAEPEIARFRRQMGEDEWTADRGKRSKKTVLKVQSQVVAGVIYDLEVLYGECGCKKDEIDLEKLQMANCCVRDEGKRAIYKIHYYEKPWENYLQIDVSKIRDVDAGEAF